MLGRASRSGRTAVVCLCALLLSCTSLPGDGPSLTSPRGTSCREARTFFTLADAYMGEADYRLSLASARLRIQQDRPFERQDASEVELLIDTIREDEQRLAVLAQQRQQLAAQHPDCFSGEERQEAVQEELLTRRFARG